MVVNRRISVSAAPPVSRTASMQPAVRVLVPSTPSIPNVNRTDGPKRERRRSKAAKPEKKRTVSYPKILQVLLLAVSVVSVYIAVACPSDSARALLLCRSLDLYRTQIIDPYILPPFESAVRHAEPYVSPLKPYVASTANFTRTRITPRISAFIDTSLSHYYARVVPRLHRLIVDQVWKGVIKPSCSDTLHPTLERYIRPFYNNYLVPGACRGIPYAQATYVRVSLRARHYLWNAQKNMARFYEVIRLHVLDLDERIRPYVVVFADRVHTYAVALEQKAGDLHREFIDPHVRKILDTIAEKHGPSSDDSSTDSSEQPLVGSLSVIPPLDTATI